jgi:hypothetical protein
MGGVSGNVESAMLKGVQDLARDGELSPVDVRKVITSLQGLKGYTPTTGHHAVENLLAQHMIDGKQAVELHDLVGVIAGERSYGTGGTHPYTLPGQARDLIRASPQLDNMDATRSDPVRCGAAAALNGLLLSGDPGAAAAAITGYAGAAYPEWRSIFPQAASAISALEKGTLTPNQAAHLQEMLFQIASQAEPIQVKTTLGNTAAIPAGGDDGMPAAAVAMMLAGLRSHGGFAGAQSVSFDCVDSGKGFAHWTVSVVDSAGHAAHADSWPGPDGRAEAGDGVLHPDVRRETGWQSSVTLTPASGGRVTYDMSSPNDDSRHYLRWSDTVAPGSLPSFARAVDVHDRS